MELHTTHLPAAARGRKLDAVGGSGGDHPAFRRPGVKRVHKISEGRIRQRREEAVRGTRKQIVPSDVRHLQAGARRETHHAPRPMGEAGNSGRFLAALEKNLVAEANPEVWTVRRQPRTHRTGQPAFLEAASAITKRPHPGKHNRRTVLKPRR